MIDLAFSSINMLFVLSFKNGNNNPTIDFINSYYMPLLEIKDFNVIIENKSFFDQPVKNKQKANEKLVEMLNNNDYTTDDDATMFFFYHRKATTNCSKLFFRFINWNRIH